MLLKKIGNRKDKKVLKCEKNKLCFYELTILIVK